MKIALVLPWFGRSLKGGAEQHAWQIATRLAARQHEVEVLTTCCRSHQDNWSTNHLPAGRTFEEEGFSTRRFPVEQRDERAFDAVVAKLLSLPRTALKRGVAPIGPEESRVFVDELIKSPLLLDYLTTHRTSYDWFIFLPYLYTPVIEGVRIARERAALLPCLHDEPYAYLSEVAETFGDAARLIFNSEGEQELALRLFGPSIWEKCHLVGGGIEVDQGETSRAAESERHNSRFVLYLGRKDVGKNVPLLVRAFQRFRRTRPNSDLRLVLAGHGDVAINGDPHITDAGLVSDEEKLSLLRNCSALFQPSENESFSRVVMEAWMHGKPVAAHRLCLATAVAVERSGGGWLAEAEEEWAQRFADVAHLDDRQLASLGTRGQAYARHLANWDEAMARLEKALAPDDPTSPRVASLPKGRVRTINQFLPNLAYGDAISNHALWIRKSLRDLGYNSEIYVRFIDPRCASECRVFSPGSLAESDAAVYHHSVGSEITSHLLGFRGPRCLIYHNITPPEYYAPYRPDFAEVLRSGKRDLSSLADHFPLSYAVSRYNAEELRGAGFREPRVMPLPVDPGVWTIRADQTVMEELQDGRTNLLYVGRMAPNKKQEDLIRAFESYLSFEPDARLILVGKAEDADPYYAYVTELVRQYQLEEHVLLPGNIDAAQLAAYYSCADLFWSMSEHEGFCVPLVEAMWFDVPVLAYRSTAIPETLGEAGLMFTDKDDVASVAAAAHLLVSDRELRRKSITAQRRRRVEFLPEKVGGYLLELVKQLEDFSPGNN